MRAIRDAKTAVAALELSVSLQALVAALHSWKGYLQRMRYQAWLGLASGSNIIDRRAAYLRRLARAATLVSKRHASKRYGLMQQMRCAMDKFTWHARQQTALTHGRRAVQHQRARSALCSMRCSAVLKRALQSACETCTMSQSVRQVQTAMTCWQQAAARGSQCVQLRRGAQALQLQRAFWRWYGRTDMRYIWSRWAQKLGRRARGFDELVRRRTAWRVSAMRRWEATATQLQEELRPHVHVIGVV
jgi:hypothetical protein